MEGDANWRAGRYRAWWVGNIVLGGQPQIGKGHSPWPKYCIKWGRCWKAGVEKQEWKKRHDMAGAGGQSSISAIGYSESSDWSVGTETI